MTDFIRTDDAPGMGHNLPPEPPSYKFFDARVEQLAHTTETWLASVKKIEDDETARACDSLLTQIRAELKAAKDMQQKINAPLYELMLPYQSEVARNNMKICGIEAILGKCQDMLKPLKVGWLKCEQQRIAAEKAAREAEALKAMEEAEAAIERAASVPTLANALAADDAEKAMQEAIKAADALKAKPQVKGDLSARASGLRQYWFAKIVDYDAALAYYGKRPEIVEVVQRLANADARESKIALDVPGVAATYKELV